jgi:hypothetical protein
MNALIRKWLEENFSDKLRADASTSLATAFSVH